jgi:N-acetylneuraminate synthase
MLEKFSILDFEIGGSRTFIIAEAGVNHNGEIDLAKELINEAKKANADAIKFQTFITEELVTSYAPKAEYQKKNTSNDENQFKMIKKLELSFETFRELKNHADNQDILFLSTPFDLPSVEFLANLGVPAFKVGSGDMNNTIMLERIVAEKKPILLSTGMASLDEISEIFSFLVENGVNELLLFHCTTNYPASIDSLNLKAISALQKLFNVPIGFSDHSLGIEAPKLAVALGAKAIEKHFTLNKNLAGPDHKASVEPEELREMVNEIRITERMLGSPNVIVNEVEKKTRIVARKSIVANRDISRSTIISREDLTVKRPGDGIPPKNIDLIIGKIAKKDIQKNDQISWENLDD